MVWPNSQFWSALADRARIEIDGTILRLSVVDCGTLVVPFGRLVACDPFAYLRPTGNPYITIPPGEYPIKVTLADVSGREDGSHIREAYASLLLGDEPEITRRVLTPLVDGDPMPELADDEFIGFPVDAGTACFVDEGTLASSMPDVERWHNDLFDNAEPDSWFNRMDDPQHIRAGLANIQLPLAVNRANIVIIHSGWGDGVYPLVGGYDGEGRLIRVHIDFMVVFPAA
jgi:hypothetical protein